MSQSKEFPLSYPVYANQLDRKTAEYMYGAELDLWLWRSRNNQKDYLVLFGSQRNVLSCTEINDSLRLQVQDKRNCTYEDSQKIRWRLCFRNVKELEEVSGLLAYAKARRSKFSTPVMQELEVGKDLKTKIDSKSFLCIDYTIYSVDSQGYCRTILLQADGVWVDMDKNEVIPKIWRDTLKKLNHLGKLVIISTGHIIKSLIKTVCIVASVIQVNDVRDGGKKGTNVPLRPLLDSTLAGSQFQTIPKLMENELSIPKSSGDTVPYSTLAGSQLQTILSLMENELSGPKSSADTGSPSTFAQSQFQTILRLEENELQTIPRLEENEPSVPKSSGDTVPYSTLAESQFQTIPRLEENEPSVPKSSGDTGSSSTLAQSQFQTILRLEENEPSVPKSTGDSVPYSTLAGSQCQTNPGCNQGTMCTEEPLAKKSKPSTFLDSTLSGSQFQTDETGMFPIEINECSELPKSQKINLRETVIIAEENKQECSSVQDNDTKLEDLVTFPNLHKQPMQEQVDQIKAEFPASSEIKGETNLPQACKDLISVSKVDALMFQAYKSVMADIQGGEKMSALEFHLKMGHFIQDVMHLVRNAVEKN